MKYLHTNAGNRQKGAVSYVSILVGIALSALLSYLLATAVSQSRLEERSSQLQQLSDHLALLTQRPLAENDKKTLQDFILKQQKLSSHILAILFYQRSNSQIIAGEMPPDSNNSQYMLLNATAVISSPDNTKNEIGKVEIIADASDIHNAFTTNILVYFVLVLASLAITGFIASRSSSANKHSVDKLPSTQAQTPTDLQAPASTDTSATSQPPVAESATQKPHSSPQQATGITREEIRSESAENTHADTDVTILIVDDDRANRMVLKRGLQDSFHLLEAENGQDCLDLIASHNVDLVLLDLMMPGMSGFDVLRHIDENPEKTFPKIIVLSALMDSTTISSVLNLGAVDYLTKPFNVEEMRARINTQIALEKRELALESIVNKRTRQLQESNKKLEATFQQLLHSEKMASIGQLAAGVAHEINNPIGFIYSNLSSLNDYITDISGLLGNYRELGQAIEQKSPDIQDKATQASLKSREIDIDYIIQDIPELLKDTIEGTERVKNIVLSLKHFSRVDDTAVDDADINAGIEATLKIVWNELKYKCDVHKDLATLPLTKCNINQLNQVFTNLFINAAQAIEKHGELNIQTRTVDDDIEIRVSDTGSGIDPQSLSKLFEPFYTTKPVGEGTGLGLYLSYEIIQKHNGSINVESTPGEGTTFIIRIPVKE